MASGLKAAAGCLGLRRPRLTQAKTQTPVFGSSSTFGGATGFGGFAGVEKPAEHDAEAQEEGPAGEGEEDCSAEFKPLVQLDEVERVSGEEAEDVLLDLCARRLPRAAQPAHRDLCAQAHQAGADGG